MPSDSVGLASSDQHAQYQSMVNERLHTLARTTPTSSKFVYALHPRREIFTSFKPLPKQAYFQNVLNCLLEQDYKNLKIVHETSLSFLNQPPSIIGVVLHS